MDGPFVVCTGENAWTVYARCYFAWGRPDYIFPLGTYATQAEAELAASELSTVSPLT